MKNVLDKIKLKGKKVVNFDYQKWHNLINFNNEKNTNIAVYLKCTEKTAKNKIVGKSFIKYQDLINISEHYELKSSYFLK